MPTPIPFRVLAILCAACFGISSPVKAALPAERFAHSSSQVLRGGPPLDPLRFFTGQGHSWGVFEDRAGRPTRRFAAWNSGRQTGTNHLRLQQNFTFEDRSQQTRIWDITRLDAHHVQATASDVVGLAHGEMYGNAFRWAYTVRLASPAGPIRTVQLRQWLYLQEDGRTIFQHAVIRKFGLTVAQVTEWIVRDSR